MAYPEVPGARGRRRLLVASRSAEAGLAAPGAGDIRLARGRIDARRRRARGLRAASAEVRDTRAAAVWGGGTREGRKEGSPGEGSRRASRARAGGAPRVRS